MAGPRHRGFLFKLLLLISGSFFIGTYILSLYSANFNTGYTRQPNVVWPPKNISKDNNHIRNNILDGCYHVYLDVGSNIGVQIRKLFEPEKYPKAKVHSIFNGNFGSVENRRTMQLKHGNLVCAVGFEPNPHHTVYLKQIETRYKQCGWKVKIMTQSGVSDHDGISRFYTDENYQKLESGGGILPPEIVKKAKDNIKDNENSNFSNITLIRLSNFLKDVVGKRSIPLLPSQFSPPRVVIKMDIEGSEVDVIPDLIFNGGLQYFNILIMEWHARKEKIPERKESHYLIQQTVKLLSDYSNAMKDKGPKHNFTLVNMDDETYGTSRFELPNC